MSYGTEVPIPPAQIPSATVALDQLWLRLGYFEGIGSQRGIAWRCGDSLSLREFLGTPLTEDTPDHSSLTKVRDRLPLEVHTAVFQLVLKLAAEKGLLKGKTVAGRDLRVVPLGDFAQENAAIGFACQLQVVLKSWEVVGQHDRPGRHGDKLDAPTNLGDFRVGHGRVAGAEVDEVLFGKVRALADEAFDTGPAATLRQRLDELEHRCDAILREESAAMVAPST